MRNPLNLISGLTTGLNWWALAAKALAVVAVAGLIFFGGYRYGTRDCVSANSPATVATAQHAQDVKQHGAATKASGVAKAQGDKTDANTGVQVKIIHDKGKVILVPANCPSNPPVDPDVINAFNAAGH